MEKRTWTGRTRALAAGCAAALLLAGIFSGMGLRRLFSREEEIPVYSVEGLRDKQWSDAVTVPAAVEAGSVTAWYYDSRKPVSEIYVTEGQAVTAGTLLLGYDCTALEEELSGVERSLKNQQIYLERLGGFIGHLKATKPLPDGLGQAGGLPAAVFGGQASGRFGLISVMAADESLEGFSAEGGNSPAVYDRVEEASIPAGGSGTPEDPYIYYIRKGGEVAPEVIVSLMRLKLCGRFVVVEDEGSLQTPLFLWDFDGRLYEEKVQGEESTDDGGTMPPESSMPESGEPESSETESGEPGSSGSGSDEPESSEPEGSGSETDGSDSSLPEGDTSEPAESTSGPEGETEPSDPFEDFDDGALDEALGGLENEPQGYTKEELSRAIRERSLEYENLELAIRKSSRQAESLRKEIEENVLAAETDGQVCSVLAPEEAARLGQPMLMVRGISGSRIAGRFSEELAAALRPGDRISVSVKAGKKEVSFEAVLQSVGTAPGDGSWSGTETGNGTETENEAGTGAGWDSGAAEDGILGDISGDASGNPAMSYYPFSASPVNASGIRAGDNVEVRIPRSLLKTGTEGGHGAEAGTGTEEGNGTIVLPDTLLFYEGELAFVYAMGEDGRLEKRQVEAGRSFSGTETEILKGLAKEDYLAYPGGADSLEGAKARILYGEEMEIGTEASEGWEEE